MKTTPKARSAARLRHHRFFYLTLALILIAGSLVFPSSTALAAPAAPSLYLAMGMDTSSIFLSWSAVTDATSYFIYRSMSEGGPYTAVGSYYSGTAFTDTRLAPDTTYYYMVTAIDSSGGMSGSSNVASAKTQAATPAPTGLSAVAESPSSISVSWSAVDGATAYGVYRSTSEDGKYMAVDPAYSGTSYTDTGLAPDTTYYYAVTAIDSSGGQSDFSAVVSAKTQAEPITVTVEQNAGNPYTTLDVSWGAVSGATNYQVYRSTSYGGEYTLVAVVSATTYSNAGLAPNTTYWYRVAAGKVAQGIGSATTAALLQPTLTATAKSASEIDLAWAAVPGAASYTLERAEHQEGPFEKLHDNLTTTDFTDTLRLPGKPYYYRVLASANESPGTPSDIAAATPHPISLSAAATGASAIDIAWGAVPDAASYTLYRFDGTDYQPLATGLTGLAYRDTGLSQGTAYSYKISAALDGQESMLFGPAEAVTDTIITFNASTGSTLTFTNRTLTDSATGVKVTGSFVSGAKLSVTKNALHKEGTCTACDEIRERMQVDSLIVLYDISATGHKGDGVSVTIPVGNGYDGRLLSVLHCDHGRLEEKILTCADGAVTGTFNSLSPFAVFDGVSVATPDEVVVDAPKTGDAGLAWVGAVCLLCALVAINRKLKMENGK